MAQTFTGKPRYAADVPPVGPQHQGCWIDGSHMSADDFARMTIDLALRFGAQWAESKPPGVPTDKQAWEIVQRHMQDLGNAWAPHPTLSEWLYETSEDAVEWLNDEVAPENYAWSIVEQDLFLSPTDIEEYGD
jgi:hypothetical protein